MAVENAQIRPLFDLYDLTPSARLHVVRKVLSVLIHMGAAAELIDRGKACAGVCAGAMGRTYDWRQRKTKKRQAKSSSSKLDAALDRSVSNLFKYLGTFLDFPPDHPKHQAAAAIVEDLFPEGVYPITSLAYENQVGAVEVVLTRLADNYANEVALLSMDDHVQHVDELLGEFRDGLNYLDAQELTYDQVLEAQAEASEEYHKLLAVLLAAFVDDAANRAKILEPFLAQNEWTARYYKRRGTSPEVDPDTGDPIDDDVPPPPEDILGGDDDQTDSHDDQDDHHEPPQPAPADEDVDVPVTPVEDPVPSE